MELTWLLHMEQTFRNYSEQYLANFFPDLYISDFLHLYLLYKIWVQSMYSFLRTDNMVVFIWEGWLSKFCKFGTLLHSFSCWQR